MKKILFVNRNLIFGGIEQSLFNLVSSIKDEYEIEIKVLKKVGENKKIFEDNFKVSQIDKKLVKYGFYYKPKKFNILYNGFYFVKRAYRRIISRLLSKMTRIMKKVKFSDEYDIAVCFTQDPICREYVLQKTKAKKKIMFLHNDISLANKNELAIERLKLFDKVVCVSNSCKEALIEISENSLNNVDYLYNYCKEIKCTDEILLQDNRFQMISASRLAPEKGLKRFLNVLSKLKVEGYNFIWYIVGSGVCEKKLKNIIKKEKLENFVKLLGYKNNHRDYIKDCDLFVLPSYQESFGMVLVEAMQVGVPCLTTKTIAAEEVIGEYGFICENTEKGIYTKLKELLDNNMLVEDKKIKLKNYHFDNEKIKEKFINILEEEN